MAHSIIAQHQVRNQLQQDKQNHQCHLMTSWATTVCKETSQERASSRLMALPVQHHRFTVHKGVLQDALALRYAWNEVQDLLAFFTTKVCLNIGASGCHPLAHHRDDIPEMYIHREWHMPQHPSKRFLGKLVTILTSEKISTTTYNHTTPMPPVTVIMRKNGICMRNTSGRWSTPYSLH